MQPFPLLDLPSLALKEALKCLDPIELFTLSQCSKKMIGKIKLAKTQKFHLTIDTRKKYISINYIYNFQISDKSSDMFQKSDITWRSNFSFKGKKLEVPIKLHPKNEKTLTSYCDDTVFAMRAMFFQLSKIFGCEVAWLAADSELPSESFRLIVKAVLEKQSGIPNFISSFFFQVQDLKWVLDTVKVTGKLYILSEQSENFVYDFKTIPQFLFIFYSNWFTLDNLLSFHSCKVIVLINSTLTNEDLDVFVNLWKEGSYPKLEYLKVRSKYLEDDVPIGGLTEMRNDRNPIRREKRINDVTYNIENGVDIQRDDGIMGTFELNENEWGAVCLQMLVWI